MAHHFRGDAHEQLPYDVACYTDEVNRLYGVMEKRLEGRDYLVGVYSIADIACWGWSRNWKRQGQNIEDFPRLKAWHERCAAHPGAARVRKWAPICAIPIIRSATTPLHRRVSGQRARA